MKMGEVFWFYAKALFMEWFATKERRHKVLVALGSLRNPLGPLRLIFL